MITALSAGEQKVLGALVDLHYATNKQITRHSFSQTSYEYVCSLTRGLVKKDMLTQDFERRKMQRGASKSIFFLSAKAQREYAARGVVLPKMKPVREHLQEHILGVNELILLTMIYASHAGKITDLRHDLVMKRDPIILQVEGKDRSFVPDLWVSLERSGKPWNFCFEYDRGTEEEATWRDKVKLLLAFAAGGVRERFGVDRLTIAIVIDPMSDYTSRNRLEKLVTWTEAELTAQYKKDWGALFLFRQACPATMLATDFYTTAAWQTPFSSERQALLF